MKCRILLIIALLFLSVNTTFVTAQNEALNILQKVSASAQNVKTLQYNAVMNERIGKKMVEKVSFFKINVSPFKVFVKQSFIGITIEGIFMEGYNKNEMLVATVGFPWIQLNIDPLSKRVRDNHHHTIYETGFKYFVEIVDKTLEKHKNELVCTLEKDEIKNGRNCYKVVIDNPGFKFISYKVKKGETLTSISKREYISDYMLLEKNPDIDYYDEVEEGQNILIPNAYAKKMILYVDKENMLPVVISIFDDKGLYAEYAYKNLVINPVYTYDEFSAKNKQYHFR